MRLFTWKDVERCILLSRSLWQDSVKKIDVYPQKLIVYSSLDRNKIFELISDILKREIDENGIILDFDEKKMHIDVEEVQELEPANRNNIIVPLFRNILYQTDSAYESQMLSSGFNGAPVISFHSYKGGVGRTLSLISFVKAWTERRNRDKSLLVIDADIEAPGLSWICDAANKEQAISYLDLLVLMQQSRNADELAEKVKDKIKICTFSYENDQSIHYQYFMPTYRYKEQLLDIYATPQNIAQGYNKRFFLGEVLSAVGKELGVEAVIVDLRAGISDFSAPILFDPRIKKYIVSSTSYQSCVGTKLLLEQLLKGLPISENTLIPEVLVTMVQNHENTDRIHDIILRPYINQLAEGKEELLDHVIYNLDYASELIRLENLQDIMSTLDGAGRKFHDKIYNIVSNNYESISENGVNNNVPSNREATIRSIHDLAEKQLTAEGNKDFQIMKTQAVIQLVSRYSEDKPDAVVLGAKGAGKTYLYKEILKREYWERFTSDMGSVEQRDRTIVVPLLTTDNITNLKELFIQAAYNFREILDNDNFDIAYYQKNKNTIRDALNMPKSYMDWVDLWKSIMLPDGISSMEQLNNIFKKKGKRILYIVDGLEELFQHTLVEKNEQFAVATLCKDVISELQIKYDCIACLVFTRKDIVQNAITINYEQFSSQYKDIELKWSRAEALRLALWLVVHAFEAFNYKNVKIESASEIVIRQELERLWGIKLGKAESNEAYSSNWILAALSDFNGQLQARDIIRFLESATEDIGSSIYNDRYIMPNEIRKAIPKCSKKKIHEIEQEIEVLKPIFKKLREAESEKKKLPFSADVFGLTKEQENIMIREGYLYNDEGKYYLPEIIRHALDFTYTKGARPRVLALMKK